MDPNTVISTLLSYGKGPFLRYIIIAIMALLGSKGVTNAQAADWANASWQLVVPALTSLLLWLWASYQRKALHEATPPGATQS